MRRTSIEAYHQIQDQGLLGRLQFLVYQLIFEHGPVTQAEVWKRTVGYQIRSITPRFSELEEMGVIEAVGERPCEYTGNVATIWDVTPNLPVKPAKKITKPEEIHALKLQVISLENQVRDLKDKLLLARQPSLFN
jgi:hypothetical protein